MTAAEVIEGLRARGWSIGTAESLTGGLVCAELTAVPGASAVVRGGVVAYATGVKASVLGVEEALLADKGAVDPGVAAQLAEGAARVLGCDVGVGTTGVAGPEPADGQPVGTVHVAVRTPTAMVVESLALTGDRDEIRRATVTAVLDLVGRCLGILRDVERGEGYG